MPLLHVIVLAIVQGITEFLPISSSGHLVLVWAGLDAQGMATPGQTSADRLALDIAVHVGTLLAVCLYFGARSAACCWALDRSPGAPR